MFWNNPLDLSIMSYSKGHIDTTIKSDKGWWRFTGFYGNPVTGLRVESWTLLERLSSMSKLPWVIGGDFNEIMIDKEKEGGAVRNYSQMNSFCEATNKCCLVD